jgi:hypothetical protein
VLAVVTPLALVVVEGTLVEVKALEQVEVELKMHETGLEGTALKATAADVEVQVLSKSEAKAKQSL